MFHTDPREHLGKLRRIVKRLLSQEMHADDMDDFCKTAWHLIEHVEKSPSSTREMRKRTNRLRSDSDFLICKYATNVEKHGRSRIAVMQKPKQPIADIKQGYGIGRYGKGDYGIGEQSIEIVTDDGQRRNGFEFVDAVLAKWEAVFELDESVSSAN